MRKIKYLLPLLLLPLSLLIQAQELNCNVMINHEQVQGANEQNFTTLKQVIEEFLNTTKWTNLSFANQERIDCNLMIVCKSVSDANLYSCEATIQASRPVYNTSYSSTLLNFKDNAFSFTWSQEPLNFQMTNYQSNLTSMLAFYAYLILGFDADSYQRMGGTPYFQVCENIVTLCQTASMETAEMKGWLAFDSNRNRYAITNNLMDEAFKPLRNYFYEYHRLGLDEMESNTANGRSKIASGMEVLKLAQKARPTTGIVAIWLDAKSEEIINIFTGGTDAEKDQICKLMIDVDPTRSNQYERMKD